MYTSWDIAKALVARLGGNSITIPMTELDAAKKLAMIAEYGPDSVTYRLGDVESWPEEPNGDMLNGCDDLEVVGS